MSSENIHITKKLRNVFGFETFRQNQKEIVEAILAGQDVFAVMPTGGGKSLCYQLPALLLDGTCVVVSPLISLMKDQVDSARSLGIAADYINSSLAAHTRNDVLNRFKKGKLDLLYLAPERLAVKDFISLLEEVPLSFIAIDEAHCISEWGHDFRPDYLILSSLKKQLPSVPLAAFTATATQTVQNDIIKRLQLKNPLLVRASFNRPNLFYRVLPRNRVMKQIENCIMQHEGEAGIVYRLSRADVEKTALYLQERGIKALPYHAGLPSQRRFQNQEAFNRDTVQVIVATVAFGMGIDKSNIRFVIHGDLPKNMEGYYQETGRAGRDGEPAHCLLLYNRGDMMRLGNFIDQMEKQEEQTVAWKKLTQMGDFGEIATCRRKQLLSYFGEIYPEDNCGACDVCAQGVEKVEATTEAQMLMSAMYRTGQRFGASHIIDIVAGARTKRITELGHDKIKTHGVGSHHNKPYWRRLIDALLAADCLKATGSPYPILQLTPKGDDVLFGRSSFSFLQIIHTKEEQTKQQLPTDYNTELFAILKKVRLTLAQQEDVPPFVIFSDKSLHEMCRFFPTQPNAMLAIHGVGQAKLARYGEPFLIEITTFLENNPEYRQTGAPLPTTSQPETDTTAGQTVHESGKLAEQGLSLAEIAEKRDLKETTIAGHLEKFLAQGSNVNIDVLIGVEKRKLLEEKFSELGTDFLKPVVDALKGKVSYNEARVIRGYILGSKEARPCSDSPCPS
ncbi:MAG: DNA helicase RecQ [Desulfobulbaceae bacterium]|nr:DNA helicase RecQ [Desulfobulbaceae bacterium]